MFKSTSEVERIHLILDDRTKISWAKAILLILQTNGIVEGMMRLRNVTSYYYARTRKQTTRYK